MCAQRLEGTLSVRLTSDVLRRLRARARAAGTTPSAMLRLLLERELLERDPQDGPPLLERTRRWVGSVRGARVPHGAAAREALEDWMPDRRG